MTTRPEDRSNSAHARQLLEIVRSVLEESGSVFSAQEIGLDLELVADLGIDSLARLEIARRIEARFGSALSESVIMAAETPRDLLDGLEAASLRSSIATRGPSHNVLPPSGASLALPHKARTLLEVLDWHCQRHHERVHVFLLDENGESNPMTYGELMVGARAVAAGLLNYQVGRGAVGLMLPTSGDFLKSFFGIMLAGAIPVPLYPPFNIAKLEDHMRRQIAILRSCKASGLVLLKEGRMLAPLLKSSLPELRVVLPPDDISMSDALPASRAIEEGDLAFLQYTSGSTGIPKGVMLAHHNVLANLRAIGAATRPTPLDVCVSWLPLYHDMGLIGAWLGSLYHACPLVLMSPLHFLASPARWLRAIHDYRGTISAAPNFAYQLCASRLGEADLEGLDLSSWRIALNGAEPVSAKAMEAFSARFEPYGFSRAAMTPVYGLAENALAVTFPPIGRGPRVDWVKRESIQQLRRAEQAEPGSAGSAEVVSCGLPLAGHEVRIVDGAGIELGEREVGRVQFKGPSACLGYFGNDEATRKLLDGAWFNSGDYGYVAGGEIYLAGREKDIIIKAGRNIYPHEIEEAISEIQGVRKGGVAVFSVNDPKSGSELLVLAAETGVREASAREEMKRKVQELCAEACGIPADEIVLVRPRSLPKTSSGKIRRSTCAQLYERGELRGGRPVALQMASLALSALPPLMRRVAAKSRQIAFAAWFWISGATLLSCAIASVRLAMSVPSGRARARAFARLLLHVCRLPVRLEGFERLAGGSAKILVANHSSYFDVVLLIAHLPTNISYVAKKELASHWLIGPFLEKLGVLFVDRIDARQGVSDLEEINKRLVAGESFLFFPEGTFCRSVGLLPFKLGAFNIASKSKRPVVPVVISGTRFLLRSDQWFPRWQKLVISILPPLQPRAESWDESVSLRDRARAAILVQCGEPDLAPVRHQSTAFSDITVTGPDAHRE